MLDGFCSSSMCYSNPSGICWSGTGSGAFTAESFQVSSLTDCNNYVDSMLYGHTRRRALQSGSGGSSGLSANSYTNRQNAWVSGAQSVLDAVMSCAGSGHRRTQDNSTGPAQGLTASQLSEILTMHLAGKNDLVIDIDTTHLLAVENATAVALPNGRRRLLDCVDS